MSDSFSDIFSEGHLQQTTHIDAAQAQNREAIGTVSVSGVASSPMDMREMLNKKAEEKGATAYQITEARSGDTWHATAELYK